MATPSNRPRDLTHIFSAQRDAAVQRAPTDGLLKLKLDDIRPDDEQPRRHFEEDALDELAASLKNHGVLQPVVVRKDGPHYRLIMGERRWRAAKLAGLKEIPALVKDVSEQDAFEQALVENLQREDLSPLEEADGYKRLMALKHLTQDEVAKRVGKERSTVTNSLRLLLLPPQVKQYLEAHQLDMGHARALLGLPTPQEQVDLARLVVNQKLSVRETEARVKGLKPTGVGGKRAAPRQSPEARQLVEELQRRLGTKVRLGVKTGGKGTLEIDFFSYEDLDRIVQLIRK